MSLTAVTVNSGRHLICAVTASESSESCAVSVSVDSVTVARGEGDDFELAFQLLRAELEALGLHLLCNRYRRDAFVTSLSRQMSGGLGCYLVEPRRPVDPGRIVDCLGPARASDVVSKEEADAFIAGWRSRPPLLLLPILLWRSWRERVRGQT
ncbi:hypothetical protein KIH74_06280 [Kineosporia sp. J2-2]|uniref:Uncharacterized protein n=1 Tax=Kineosporia corallincola TaxID=2835133 RepID=A0ABS5TDN8_9ACTN|nr:hypothetical protein [Kineosporia corallincola]MBT0768524.1 hypothetical protein [Kineosporia corallincola]